MPLPKLRIGSRRDSLVRTSREVCDRTLLRVVLTELGTNPTDIGIKCSSHIRCQAWRKDLHPALRIAVASVGPTYWAFHRCGHG